MGKLDGKVAFITGAARGQGRSHAVKLASEGADIIATDSCADTKTALYPMATEEDLAETVRLVEALDRRIVATKADVRDHDHLKEVVAAGVAELGRLDIVSANAGICTLQEWDEVTPEIWQETIDINLTGVWNTCVAAIPHLLLSKVVLWPLTGHELADRYARFVMGLSTSSFELSAAIVAAGLVRSEPPPLLAHP